VPVYDRTGRLIAVFDVDSTELASFDAIDEEFLTRIMTKHFAR
jgi:GAF domain-containing protein